MTPLTDRSGRLSPLKIAVLVAALFPAIWIGSSFAVGSLGPLPFDTAISETGKWAIRLLLLSLLITPLLRAYNRPRLIIVRRMIGLAALAYGLLHFCVYVADQGFHLGHVFSEIAHRIYLTIGFVALAGLAVLRPAPLVLIAGLTLMIIGEALVLIRHAAGSMPVLATSRSSE